MKRYFYARGESQRGPFSAAQMRGLAAAGHIRPTDLVWKEKGSSRRVQASKVRTLFAPPRGSVSDPDGAAPPHA